MDATSEERRSEIRNLDETILSRRQEVGGVKDDLEAAERALGETQKEMAQKAKEMAQKETALETHLEALGVCRADATRLEEAIASHNAALEASVLDKTRSATPNNLVSSLELVRYLDIRLTLTN